MLRMTIRPLMISLVLLLVAIVAAVPQRSALADDGPFVTKTVEADFDEVFTGLKDVITGKGINIAHTLGASEMLNRTGPAFGVKKNIYINAETVEFCSAKLSHKLAAADPRNVVLCPFAISVYVTTKEPKKVHLTYRKLVANKGSEKVLADITKFMDEIVAEATDW